MPRKLSAVLRRQTKQDKELTTLLIYGLISVIAIAAYKHGAPVQDLLKRVADAMKAVKP